MDPFTALLGGAAASIGGSAAGFGMNALFGGGGGPQFEPTPLMEEFPEYAIAQVKPPKYKKKADIAEFKNFVKSGDRGAGEDYLRMMAEMYPQERQYSKRLKKSLKKDVNFLNPNAFALADDIYTDAGLGFTDAEYRELAEQARLSGIRGSSEFGDFLKQNLIAQGKIRTPQEEALDLIFGTPGRSATGVYGERANIAKIEPITYTYTPSYAPSSTI